MSFSKLFSFMILSVAIVMAASTLQAEPAHPRKSKTPKRSTASSEPPIRAGASITVLKVNTDRTLEVQINTEKGVGPNITTAERLVEAIGIDDAGDRKSYIDNPSKFKGTEYVLQRDLELIDPPNVPMAPKRRTK